MQEIRDKDGKLLAVIHDTDGFLKLINQFEQHKYHYDRHHILLSLPINLLYDQNSINYINYVAEQLRAMRKQLGDEREGLYPVKTSRENKDSQ
jgi:hypothetical protein